MLARVSFALIKHHDKSNFQVKGFISAYISLLRKISAGTQTGLGPGSRNWNNNNDHGWTMFSGLLQMACSVFLVYPGFHVQWWHHSKWFVPSQITPKNISLWSNPDPKRQAWHFLTSFSNWRKQIETHDQIFGRTQGVLLKTQRISWPGLTEVHIDLTGNQGAWMGLI